MGSKNCNIMHSNTISKFIKTGLILLSLAGYLLGLLLVLSLKPVTTILGIIFLFFLCCTSYPKIRNNKVINYLYNVIIYVLLLVLFLYVSRVLIWFKIASGDLSFLDVLIVLFAFILDMVLVAMILSVRSNWKTLFFGCDHVLSWKTILKKELFLAIIVTFVNSMLVSIMAFQILDTYSGFEFNNQLRIHIMLQTLFSTIILFEFSFFWLLLNTKVVTNSRDRAREPIGRSVKVRFTNSKAVLIFILGASIISAKYTSERINDVLLGNINSFDWMMFITSICVTLVLFGYFIISLNSLTFKYFNLKYDIGIKDIIGISIISTFLFINAIYLTRHLAVALVYLPSEIPDSQFEVVMQQLCTLSGGPSFYDPIIIKMTTFFLFLIISVSFAIVIYGIFLHYTFKKQKQSLELGRIFDQIVVGDVHTPLGSTGQEIIKKVFSKPLKNSNFIQYFSYFYYMFCLCTGLISSLLVTYLLVSDSMFGKNTFMIFAFKYQYAFAAYSLFGLVLLGIFEEVQKIRKYKVTEFISKKNLYGYIKHTTVYLSITISCSIAVFVRYVYQTSEKYVDIVAPESIQVFHCVIFLYISGYVLLIVSKKLEEIFIKEIEE